MIYGTDHPDHWSNMKIDWPRSPEYLTVLHNDAFSDTFLDLCHVAPDAVILAVDKQADDLLTIQYPYKLRYPIFDHLDDAGCFVWPGIVLLYQPRLIWGDVRHLKVLRHPSGQIISPEFRVPNWWTLRARRRNLIQKWKKSGWSRSTPSGNGVWGLKGRLTANHTMDFVRNLKHGKQIS